MQKLEISMPKYVKDRFKSFMREIRNTYSKDVVALDTNSATIRIIGSSNEEIDKIHDNLRKLIQETEFLHALKILKLVEASPSQFYAPLDPQKVSQLLIEKKIYQVERDSGSRIQVQESGRIAIFGASADIVEKAKCLLNAFFREKVFECASPVENFPAAPAGFDTLAVTNQQSTHADDFSSTNQKSSTNQLLTDQNSSTNQKSSTNHLSTNHNSSSNQKSSTNQLSTNQRSDKRFSSTNFLSDPEFSWKCLIEVPDSVTGLLIGKSGANRLDMENSLCIKIRVLRQSTQNNRVPVEIAAKSDESLQIAKRAILDRVDHWKNLPVRKN